MASLIGKKEEVGLKVKKNQIIPKKIILEYFYLRGNCFGKQGKSLSGQISGTQKRRKRGFVTRSLNS